MYRKVKVRELKFQDDEHVAVGLQMLESLNLRAPFSPEKEHQDASPPFIARVPKSPLRNVVTLTISTCKEAEKNDEKIVEKGKPNIKATSIMRPRAVLSSPDNDAVMGNKNKRKAERSTALRNHNMVPNRNVNAQCKGRPIRIISKSQINTASSNDAPDTDNKSDLKGKKGLVKAVPSQRLRTWKF